MLNILGRVLDHRGDMNSEQEAECHMKTIKLRKKNYSNSSGCRIEGHYNGEEMVRKKSEEEFSQLLKEQEERRSRANSSTQADDSYLKTPLKNKNKSKFSSKENASPTYNIPDLNIHKTCQ